MNADALIALPKEIVSVGRWCVEGGHWRLDAAARSGDTPFIVFVRVLQKQPENFSIGLTYQNLGRKPTILLRLNGDHGEHANPKGGGHFSSGPHLHAVRAPLRFDPPKPGADCRWAWPMPPECVVLPLAWRAFREQVGLAYHRKMSGHIAELHAKIAQQHLPFSPC